LNVSAIEWQGKKYQMLGGAQLDKMVDRNISFNLAKKKQITSEKISNKEGLLTSQTFLFHP
jgi:hypothetical protein